VPAPAEGLAVRDDFRVRAGVDVIHAALDATGDDVVAVAVELGVVQIGAQPIAALEDPGHHLVHALPVASQADG